MFLIFLVGLLSVVGLPEAVGQGHVGKDRAEGGILGTAGVDAESDLTPTLPHMCHAHLPKGHAVIGAFDQIVILTAAEAIPHRAYRSGDLGGCPIGIAVIGHHTAEMLYPFVFIFHRCLEPVFAVKIHDDAARIKAAQYLSGSSVSYWAAQRFTLIETVRNGFFPYIIPHRSFGCKSEFRFVL